MPVHLAAVVFVLVALTQFPPSNPARLVAMQHHFAQVFAIHEAIIRGDLPATRKPAAQLAEMPMPSGLSLATASHVASIQSLARRVADADALPAAATATASMLNQCGECHRVTGVPVTVVTPSGHDVGGIVGHMLEHQRAADAMLAGLVTPSASLWQSGAERLAAAQLLPEGSLPDDPKLTNTVRAAEARVHAIAAAAVGDTTPDARISRYAELITACASCHGLHPRIWGPTKTK